MFLVAKKSMGVLQSLRFRGWVGIIIVETVIVILGVYVAAGLGNLRDRALQRERFELIVTSLALEIEPFVEQSSEFIGAVRDDFDNWQTAYDAGDRPLPFFLPATVFLARPHQAIWVAMLDAGGLDLLPVELLTQVAEFYERSERMTERYNTISAFAREQVLPYLDSGATHFYPEGDAELRTMYSIHMQELETVLIYAERTIELGQALQEDPLIGNGE